MMFDKLAQISALIGLKYRQSTTEWVILVALILLFVGTLFKGQVSFNQSRALQSNWESTHEMLGVQPVLQDSDDSKSPAVGY